MAKADTKLFNRASQVAIVRSGDRTVLTISNDFEGDPKEFAVVVPVPTFLAREQIHVGDRSLLDHLDAYSSPRLVEYFDADPCQRSEKDAAFSQSGAMRMKASAFQAPAAKSLGVTIEARYSVGEYDILILSARESSGLEAWLRQNGYRIPDGASSVLASYIKQNLRFFVAKVNLTEQAKLGFSYLRPLQVAYESPKFMLPIRLGTVNANGPQELFLYMLTPKGRVETTNYRTVKLPSDMDVPVYLKGEFPAFYKALFTQQVKRDSMHSVVTEYAWDMNWCDPCSSAPLSREELQQLGVFWMDEPASGQPKGTFLTRLHVRYDAAHFPEDLVFQETADRTNFQGRYVLRHAFAGELTCAAAQYKESVHQRHEREASTLAELTGWDLPSIRAKMNLDAEIADPRKWWEKLWSR